MKASQFPRVYRAWNLETSKMLMPEKLVSLGLTISPDGLPAYRERPFDLVLMWFTGKVDFKKLPIFEGDICKVEIENDFGSVTVDYGIMRWNADIGSFMLMIPSATGGVILNVQKVELLGNEFENPELVPLVKHETKEAETANG